MDSGEDENSGEGNLIGSSMKALALMAGDDRQNRQYRSVLSFDTSSLPDNAQIISASLQLNEMDVRGSNPLETHKKLLLDIQKGYFNLPELQPKDFQSQASLASAGYLVNNLQNPRDWFTFSLYKIAFDYVNKAGVTQFRSRFELDDNNDNIQNILWFYWASPEKVDTKDVLMM